MKNSEKGSSFIEILVVVALTAIIALGISMTTVQVFGVTDRNQEINIAVRNAQNIGSLISEELLMAESVTTEDIVGTSDTEFLTIFSKNWESGYTYETRYIWDNPSDSEKDVIKKQITFNENGTQVSSVSTLIAKNISSFGITTVSGVTQLTIQSQSDDSSVTRKYYVRERLP